MTINLLEIVIQGKYVRFFINSVEVFANYLVGKSFNRIIVSEYDGEID